MIINIPHGFESTAGWKIEARSKGVDVIDLSVGASDMMCPQEPLETLRVRGMHHLVAVSFLAVHFIRCVAAFTSR